MRKWFSLSRAPSTPGSAAGREHLAVDEGDVLEHLENGDSRHADVEEWVRRQGRTGANMHSSGNALGNMAANRPAAGTGAADSNSWKGNSSAASFLSRMLSPALKTPKSSSRTRAEASERLPTTIHDTLTEGARAGVGDRWEAGGLSHRASNAGGGRRLSKWKDKFKVGGTQKQSENGSKKSAPKYSKEEIKQMAAYLGIEGSQIS